MRLPAIAVAAFHTVRVGAPTLVESVLGRVRISVCDERLDSWSRALVEHAAIELEVEGGENAPPGESFVVMSNHQSLYDIPVLFQALRRPLRMVAKKELFRIPVMGGAMRAAGFVEVDRQNRAQAIRSLENARAALAQGISIWIAPEGTRSESGALGEFKKGGFHMALGAGARILPVTLIGTRDVLLARDWRVHPGARVRVVVSPPIDPAAYGRERRDELVRAVRAVIAAPLPS
jgi:1-acyl-sn-glycerol-3-phosphate acyltransferase